VRLNAIRLAIATASGILAAAAPAQVTVTSITPVTGAYGGTLKVTGSGFGTTKPTVTIGASACTVQSFTATTAACIIPIGTGSFAVKVRNASTGATNSTGPQFTYDATPAITSIEPVSAAPGTPLTIKGYRFASGATVMVGSLSCPVKSVTSGAISCTVPNAAAGAASVSVVVAGRQSNAKPFTYLAASAPPSGGGGGGTAIE